MTRRLRRNAVVTVSKASEQRIAERLDDLLKYAPMHPSHPKGHPVYVFAAAVDDALLTLEAAQSYLLEKSYTELSTTLDGAVAELENAAELLEEAESGNNTHPEDAEASLDDLAKYLYADFQRDLERNQILAERGHPHYTRAELTKEYRERAASTAAEFGVTAQEVLDLGERLTAQVQSRRARRNPARPLRPVLRRFR